MSEITDPDAATTIASADVATAMTTESGANAASEPTSAARQWPWWVALGLVLCLLVGAGVAAASARSARVEAATERRHARVRVVAAHHDLAQAQARRARARAAARDVRVHLAGPLATVENLVQLGDQGLTASRDAQAIGADPASNTSAGVDAYNDAVTRANVTADQFNAALDRLGQQLDEQLGVTVPVV